jgi:hypothetical protein
LIELVFRIQVDRPAAVHAVRTHVLQRRIHAAILGIATTGRGSGQPDQGERLGGEVRVVLGDAVGQHGVLTAESDGAEGLRTESGEGLLKHLARNARIQIGGLVCQRAAVVLRQRLQGIADIARLRIEEGFELEHSHPISDDGLGALQADPGLAQVARRDAGDRVIAVLLYDVCAAGDEVIADGRAMALVLQTDIDDSIESNPVPGQAVVGSRTLRARHTRRRRKNAAQDQAVEKAPAAPCLRYCSRMGNHVCVTHSSNPRQFGCWI